MWFVGGFQSFGIGGVNLPAQTVHFVLGEDEVATVVGNQHDLHKDGQGQSLSAEVGPFGAVVSQLSDGVWMVTSGFDEIAGSPSASVTPAPHAALVRFEIDDDGLCDTPVEE